MSLPGDPAGWTLQDLSAVARVSGRVGKHLLAEVSGAPDGDMLEALRNSGVVGLVVGLSLGEEAISGLKDALLNMPRPGADRRSVPAPSSPARSTPPAARHPPKTTRTTTINRYRFPLPLGSWQAKIPSPPGRGLG